MPSCRAFSSLCFTHHLFALYFITTLVSSTQSYTALAHLSTLCPLVQTFFRALFTALFLSYVVLLVMLIRSLTKNQRGRGQEALNEPFESDDRTSHLDRPLLSTGSVNESVNEESLDNEERRERQRQQRQRRVHYTLFGGGVVLLIVLFVVPLLVWALLSWVKAHTTTIKTGTLTLPGLFRPVTIRRDEKDEIHIQAFNPHDLAFAQGVVHMQERMWQITLQTAVARGTLSSLVGADALDIDKMSRLMGYTKVSERNLLSLQNSSVAILQAFVDGANAYLDTNPPIQLEFLVLGIEPLRMQLSDPICWSKIMSYSLSGNLDIELYRFALLTELNLTMSRIYQLIPAFDTSRWPTILPSHNTAPVFAEPQAAEEPIVAWLRRHDEFVRARPLPINAIKTLQQVFRSYRQLLGPTHASNSWVLSGNRTATGKPLLCNDPHLQLTAPSLWLLVHLQEVDENTGAVQSDTIGASLAGVLNVLIGRSNQTSWGLTNTGADCQDLFVMKDSLDGLSYEWNGVMRSYDIVHEIIEVKDSDPITMTFRKSHYGPVISDLTSALPTIGNHAPPALSLSLRWTSLFDVDTTMEAFQDVSEARNFSKFRDALRKLVAPSQNMIFASTNGDIGYQMPGLIPVRTAGHSGMVPAPGDGSCDWTGYVDFDSLPTMLNPSQDYIVTANNRVTSPTDPIVVSRDWDSFDGMRAARIIELITSQMNHTTETMRNLQKDGYTLLYRDFRPLLAVLQPSTAAAKHWLSRLLEFDGNLIVGSEEATVFELFMLALSQVTMNELGENNYRSEYLFRVFVKGQPETGCDKLANASHVASKYSDDIVISSGCLAFASKALDDVVNGTDHSPKWGDDIKKAFFLHPILGRSPLACLVNRQVSHGGDIYTVNVGSFSDRSDDIVASITSFSDFAGVSSPSLPQTAGSSYRQIVDMNDLENSFWQNTMGQDGNVMSSEYDNTLANWANLYMQPMRMKNFYSVATQTLQPT